MFGIPRANESDLFEASNSHAIARFKTKEKGSSHTDNLNESN